jgi:hypothetical protein
MELFLVHCRWGPAALAGTWSSHPSATGPSPAEDHPLARALSLHSWEQSHADWESVEDHELRALALRALDDPPIHRLRAPWSIGRDHPTFDAAWYAEGLARGHWPLPPTLAFNHLTALGLLGKVGLPEDVPRLRPGLAPTRPLLPPAQEKLHAWLEEHNRGYECIAGGCTEHQGFDSLAADLLRLLNMLSVLEQLEFRHPGCITAGGLLESIATIAREDPLEDVRDAARALLQFIAEPVKPHELGRDNPRETQRLRAIEEMRDAADPPLAELARLVDSESSGPALCAACILLERDLGSHATRVLLFTRRFPPGADTRGPAAKYTPYAHLLNAWISVLVHVDPAIFRDPESLLALASRPATDPGLACATALALFQHDPARHRPVAHATAQRHANHPLSATLARRLARVPDPT